MYLWDPQMYAAGAETSYGVGQLGEERVPLLSG